MIVELRWLLNEMKSITCFIGALGGGGAEHQMTQLAEMLVEKGYTVSIATFLDIPDHYPLSQKVKRIRLAPEGTRFAKIRAIFRFFLSVKTDCVISYTQRANLLCLIPLLFRRKIKVIVGERNMSRGKQTKREKQLFNFLYNRADFIVPNSITQAKYIVGKKSKFESKVVPINNYTDINLFKASPLPLGSVLRIAIFARFQRQKNCLRFAEMLGLLKKCSTRRFEIDWYGRHDFDNPTLTDYFTRFEAKVKEEGIEDILHIKDPVKDVSHQLTNYDVVCLPSVLEGFSNSIAEGIASGKPMLVSDISDNSRMVRQGENGMLFNPFEVSDMLDVFKRFLALSDETLVQMGQRSREIAEELFDRDRFIQDYIRLIEAK